MLSVLRLWSSGVQLLAGLSLVLALWPELLPAFSSPAPVPVLSRIQRELAVSEIIETSESSAPWPAPAQTRQHINTVTQLSLSEILHKQ